MAKELMEYITIPYQKILDITNLIETTPNENKGEIYTSYGYVYRLYQSFQQEMVKISKKIPQEVLSVIEPVQIDFYMNAFFALQEKSFMKSLCYFKDFIEYTCNNKEEKKEYISVNEYVLASKYVNTFYEMVHEIWCEQIKEEKVKSLIIEQTGRTERLAELIVQNIFKLDPRLLPTFKDWYDGKMVSFSYRNISLDTIKEKEKCSDIDAIFSMSTLMKNPDMLKIYKQFDFRRK